MKASFDEGQPIFQQIAEMIEDDILNKTYGENEQVMSTTAFAKTFQINPATAVKGINLLVEEGILYKRRGLGMFVAEGAKEKILTKRKDSFYRDYVMKLLNEAGKIELTTDDVIKMIKNGDRS
ncbi:GntR family transcriptional regulator [Chengkuizengella sp. 2205SS18-9]|uniref:GntR family transcriptional regulator n=1 Tax=Chengkuizengella axinellae TaxID=3064388 RepID=A0ABT9J2U0_9BACL|nr:GntR family transcriptional regulator [Chengkuizengella sp. 2205SS18-9]MDP5275324.1 GntR family transcriptional regulator [Chengkuizengella sp. 2205SS18-9]